jgi:hypothetical protein
MKLKAKLPDSGHIFLSNHDGQTSISLESSGDGSSQSQARSFSTGDWKGQPSLAKTADGFVLQLEAEQGNFAFEIKHNSVQQIDKAPADSGEKIELQEAAEDEGASKMKPMAPMKPMQPMKPLG